MTDRSPDRPDAEVTRTGEPGPVPHGSVMCAALAEEAVELAALLRVLQDDFTTVRPGVLPSGVVVSAQALDRVCQTLDDFGAIFARLATSGEARGLDAAAIGAAIGAARQDHLRRRLLSGRPQDPAEAELELF